MNNELIYKRGKLVFDEPVTNIGSSAFNWRTSLSSITIPNSVTSIGYGAFYYCSSLTSITIPNSVTEIGQQVFYECSSLVTINVDSNNPNYSSVDGVLFNKDQTTLIQYPIGNTRSEYTIPNTVTSIEREAFRDCSSFTSVTIPNSVTSIGTDAFINIPSITSIVVEAGNPEYDSRDNCNAIIETATNTLVVGCQNTIIPNSVTSIGYDAFRGCSSLKSVTIPDSVTSIGSWAFDGCSSLTSITIPNSVTDIEQLAFCNCQMLTSVVIIGNSAMRIRNGVFSGTGIYNDESNWENDVLYIDNCLIDTKEQISGTYTIKENTRLIADQAFSRCSSLTSVVIPDSVIEIGSWTFGSCESLISVTIGNSVTNIRNYAFTGCSSLTSVTIGNGVMNIEYSAFLNCTSLTSITIPSSVKSIGNGAFSGCSSLTSITCEATTPPTLGASNNLSNDQAVYVPAESVDLYKQTTNWSYYSDIIQAIP